VRAVLASIPSPGDNAIHVGPVELRAYGLMIALGVLAGVEVARRRFAARGLNPDDMSAIALWAVPAGLIGSRIYHVITDWKRFQGDWWSAFAIWHGGLGIPGGIALGVIVGAIVARRRGVPLADGLDAATPALPLAQAIGRFGNWFNQELFGRPTDLPWGLEIDPDHRPARYADEPTFHPTFLYEALWNLALCGFLLWLDRRGIVRRGRLFWVYLGGYGLGRLWVESLRVDPASKLGPFRVNIWVSLALIVAGIVGLLWPARSGGDEPGGAVAEVEDAEVE
jgi:phosphatidylglycerol---prolipoprotein diacylglyceryl transferase